MSLGSHIVGGGASNSGTYKISAISSDGSTKGKCGGASGCVRAARSVATRSSMSSLAEIRKVSNPNVNHHRLSSPSGTGRFRRPEVGATARVKLIISSMDASDPLDLVRTRALPSLPSSPLLDC